MVRLTISMLVALLLAVSAAAAPVFRASNGFRVVAEAARTFNVPFQGSDDRRYWCAAGDFVQLGLGLPGRTPIYRLSEPPRRQAQGLRFSLDAAGAAQNTGVTIFGNAGPRNSVSATIARNLCPEVLPRLRDF